MKSVVIAGSGPVGSFAAVLCAQLGYPVTVYEKRAEFSRNINLKLESSFFEKVQDVLSRLNVKSEFFAELNQHLSRRKNVILIKELEERFANEAKSLGAKYIIKEVESFEELYHEHKAEDPVILDCTGRSSKLRIKEFGPDESNIVAIPLQHAMYINCKAKMSSHVSLYQVMKYIGNIKLTEVIVSKCKDNNGFSDITVPVFIDDKLACVFDIEHPDINRNPLNPFNSLTPVSDSIFLPISSIVGNLIVDGCNVDLNTVAVKKIEISCGYAIKRSNDKYVCLGDSAIFLAFFRSLNLGLKHALDFFIQLSMLPKENNVQVLNKFEVTRQFKEHNPHLNPVMAHPTVARNVYLVVTKANLYECFSFNLTNYTSERLTLPSGINEGQIWSILEEFNKKLRSWSNLLEDFEAKRDEDIKNEIHSNTAKSEIYNYASWFIGINGKSFIKISELARALKCKYPLFKKDFEFFSKCFRARREAIISGVTSDCKLINIICNLVNQEKSLTQLREICANKSLSSDEKIDLVKNIIYGKRRINQLDIIGAELIGLISEGSDKNVNSNFILALIRNELSQSEIISSECSSTLDTFFNPVAGPSKQRGEEEIDSNGKFNKQKFPINTNFDLIGGLQKGVSYIKDVEEKGSYVANRIAKVSGTGINLLNDVQKEFTGINFKDIEKSERTYDKNPENKNTRSNSANFTEMRNVSGGATSSVLSPIISAAAMSKKLILPKMDVKSKFSKLTKLAK